jgi:hypothetical protein
MDRERPFRQDSFAGNPFMSNPRSDRVFRVIFQRHPESLRHLLNSFLPLPYPIVYLEYLSSDIFS